MEEVLVHDVVEEILKRLPVKSLMRFKSISKQWKSTIESHTFQEKHLIHHQNPKKPNLLSINTDTKSINIITLESKSSISNTVPIPDEINFNRVYHSSCDGLICLYNDEYHFYEYNSITIFNPATRWYRILPPPIFHYKKMVSHKPLKLFGTAGFGKDIITGLYKPVWLCNSNKATTTCQVFDFNINAWRFAEPLCKNPISYMLTPVYLNGLLYWLTEKEEGDENTNLLSFDFHTETFEIVCEISPFHITLQNYMTLQNLSNELCLLYHKTVESSCEIWSLNLEDKTWKKICFMDFGRSLLITVDYMEEKKKLILYDFSFIQNHHRIILYDPHIISSDVVHIRSGHIITKPISYFQSLISIL